MAREARENSGAGNGSTREARERERDAQRNQRQLDLEAQNVAHLRAHQVRVDRYHARIRQDKAKRSEEVAAKHKQAMQARQDYQDSLIRRDEEQAEDSGEPA